MFSNFRILVKLIYVFFIIQISADKRGKNQSNMDVDRICQYLAIPAPTMA